MATDKRLRAIIELMVKGDKKVENSLKGIAQETGNVERATKKNSSVLTKVSDNWQQVAFGMAAVTGAAYTLKKAWDFGAEGAQIEKVRDTFDKLTTSVGETSSVVMGSLRQATAGMVSDTQLMASANKFLSMGLADTGTEAAELARIAVTLGSAMGKDAAGAMEEWALLLANQSIPRLDTFGISAGKVRDRIAELQGSNEDMSRETAFMTAVMEEGAVSMEKLGDEVPTDGFTQMEAETANLKDEMKLLVNKGLGPVASGLAETFRTARTNQGRLNDLNKAVKLGYIEHERLAEVMEQVWSGAITEGQALSTLEEEVQAVTDAQIEYGIAVGVSDVNLRNYITTTDGATKATKMTEEQIKAVKEEMARYGAAMANASAVQRGYASSAFDASLATERMGENWRNGMANLSLLNEKLDDLGSFMVTVGGRTADQNEILSDAQQEYDRLGKTISRMTAAPELYGLTVEEVAEKTAELADRQAELLPLISRMGDITGSAAMATNSATANVDAMNEALFAQVQAAGSSSEEIAALGLSLGVLNEEQAMAVIMADDLQKGITAIKDAYQAQGISADEARQAINILGTEGLAAMNDFLNNALTPLSAKLEEIRQQIDNMPEYKRIEFELVTTGQAPNDLLHGGGVPGGTTYNPNPAPPPPSGGGVSPPPPGGNVPEFASGADFIVPPGGAYPMLVHPGEHVQVTPKGRSSGGAVINIDARGASPGVGSEIERAVKMALVQAGIKASSISRTL